MAIEIRPVKLDILRPPKDDLLSKIKSSWLTLRDGDVIALSSKVVAIAQGRCVPTEGTDKDALVRREAERYLERDQVPGRFVMHTITCGAFIPNAGVDPFGGYYILWPKNPQKSARKLLAWFKRQYKCEQLYLVLTDSRSVFLRRGVVGMAVAWAGFEARFDGRNEKDLLGFQSGGGQVNVPDSIAAAAVLSMGEGNEQTPLVVLRGVPYVGEKTRKRKKVYNTFEFPMEEDIFAPFLTSAKWKKGGKK